MSRCFFVTLVGGLWVVAAPAHAQDVFTGNNDWGISQNWSEGHSPNTGENVIVNRSNSEISFAEHFNLSNLYVGDGGTGSVDIGQGGSVISSSGQVILGMNAGDNGTITVDGNLTSGSVLIGDSGTGSLSVSGGVININVAIAVNTGSTGTLTIQDASALSSGNIGTGSGTASVVFADQLNETYGFNFSGDLSLSQTTATTLILTGTNSYTGGTTVSAGTLQGTTASVQGNIVNNGAVVFSQSGAGTYSGVMSGAGSVTITGGGAVTYTGASTGTGTTTVSAGSSLIGTTVTLPSLITDNGTVVFNQTAAGGIRGTIAGTGSVISSGTSTLTVATAQTYSGGTTVSGGVLAVANNSALGAGAVNLAGGTLSLAANPAGIAVKFDGGLIVNGSNSSAGPAVTGTDGVVPFANWNNLAGVSGSNVALHNALGASTTASVSSFTSPNTWGTGSTDPLLEGYLDHTSAGNTNVSLSGIPYSSYEVIVYFGSDGTGRTGSVTIGGTTYHYTTMGPTTSYVQSTDTTGATNPSADYAIFTGETASSLTLTMNLGSGNSGLMGVEIVSTGVTSPAIALTNAVNVTANSTIDVTGSASSGSLTGTLSIGAYQLSITGGSTGANAPYSLTLGAAGTTLTGSPTFNVANNGTGTGTLTVSAINDQGGGYGFTKTGAGSMVLTGASAYSGATLVTAGNLIVSGSISGTSQVVVASGGLLGSGAGSSGGTIQTGANGSVTVQSGGTLSPGYLNSPSTFTLTLNSSTGAAGSLNLQPGSSSDFKLTLNNTTVGGGINDFVAVNGNLSLGGTLYITPLGGALRGPSTYELFSYTGTLSGSLALDPNFLAQYPKAAILTSTPGEVLLFIPEPGNLALPLTGAGLLAGLRPSRKRRG